MDGPTETVWVFMHAISDKVLDEPCVAWCKEY